MTEREEERARRIEAATGLSRVRLAEILYEHEGFVDHARDNHMPDRPVPVWIEQALTSPHEGDCNGVPGACLNCHATMALEQYDALVCAIERAAHITSQNPGDAGQSNHAR